jgi:uncharacterized protein (DUF488 family)
MTAGRGASAVLTIGHSRHAIERFLALLAQHGVELLIDARSQPYSRFSPQFSRKALAAAVEAGGVRYRFLGDELGGRPPQPACYRADGTLDPDRVEQLAGYQRGIDELVAEIARGRAAVMCAEEDPVRCHRRLLIARTLVRRGIEVVHIRGSGALEPELGVERAGEPQLGLFPAEGAAHARRRRSR